MYNICNNIISVGVLPMPFLSLQDIQARLEPKPSNQGILQRWFPGWGQRAPTPADPEGSDTDRDEATLEGDSTLVVAEEDELLDELGYESEDSMLLRDRIFLTLSFSLNGGSLQILSVPKNLSESIYGPEPLLELGFSSLCCSVDLRPRLRYATVDLSLGSLSVLDHTDSDSLFPVLVQPKGVEVCVCVCEWVGVTVCACVYVHVCVCMWLRMYSVGSVCESVLLV